MIHNKPVEIFFKVIRNNLLMIMRENRKYSYMGVPVHV